MAADPFPARSTIALSQLEQLRRLLAALVPANSFYTRKFSRAGVTAAVKAVKVSAKVLVGQHLPTPGNQSASIPGG